MRRRLAIAAVVLCPLPAPAEAAVHVDMTPATVSTRLGNNFTVTSAIRSDSARATARKKCRLLGK
jgi:hypothetical protein